MRVPSGYEAAGDDMRRYLNFVSARSGDRTWIADGRTWQRQSDGTWIARAGDPVRHDDAAINRAVKIGGMEMAAQDQQFTRDDLLKDRVLGRKAEVTEHEDGTWTADLKNLEPEEKRRFMEMEAGYIEKQAEISDERSAGVEFVTLRDADGRERQVVAEHADAMARRDGLREVRR